MAWLDRAKIDSAQVMDLVPDNGNKPLCRSPITTAQ